MGTLKPTTPLRAPEQQPLKPPSPLLAPNQGTTETDDTSAPEKCTKNAHFSPAKAMAVSGEAQPAPAKATVVSIPLEHERAKAMAVSTPHEYQRAKATAVSDNRAVWSAEPGHSPRGRQWGLARLRDDAQSTHQRPSPTGVEGAGGTGGPGCGAHGRRRGLARQHTDTPTDWRPPRGLRGLAGLRDDAPSEARSADGERAGRPRGGRRSVGATSNKQQAAHTKTPTRNRVGVSEPPVGIEPTTYSLRVNRSAD